MEKHTLTLLHRFVVLTLARKQEVRSWITERRFKFILPQWKQKDAHLFLSHNIAMTKQAVNASTFSKVLKRLSLFEHAKSAAVEWNICRSLRHSTYLLYSPPCRAAKRGTEGSSLVNLVLSMLCPARLTWLYLHYKVWLKAYWPFVRISPPFHLECSAEVTFVTFRFILLFLLILWRWWEGYPLKVCELIQDHLTPLRCEQVECIGCGDSGSEGVMVSLVPEMLVF